MARKSNDAILKEAADEIAGAILDVTFEVLKANGINGLKVKRELIERVHHLVEAMSKEDEG